MRLVRRRLVRRDDAARLGALVPDLPYFHRYAVEVVRYLAKLPGQPSPWGAAIHDGGAIALLGGLLAVARRERDELLGAIALGVASHCAIDRAMHPLVNALARRTPTAGPTTRRTARSRSSSRSGFHEQYLGRDTMGTPAITGYLTIHLAGQLDEQLSRQLREAWAALGGARRRRRARRGARARLPPRAWLRRHAARQAHRAARRQGGGAPATCAARGAPSRRCSRTPSPPRSRSSTPPAPSSRPTTATPRPPPSPRSPRLLPAGTIDPQGEALDLDRPVAIALATG